MTAEIRITRKGIIFFLVLNIILIYIISGRGCSNKNQDNSSQNTNQQQNSVIRQQPVTQQEETIQSISDQGRLIEKTNIEVEDRQKNDNANLPTIYAITPTYARPLQKAELTRWVLINVNSRMIIKIFNFPDKVFLRNCKIPIVC